MFEKKQNVFDDFIAAAEFLIKEGYTTSEKLAISGGSNGGLLVGAAMTQRPELFAVAMPAVGVMDMLRYHKFTIGWGWVPEYGSADSTAHFRFIGDINRTSRAAELCRPPAGTLACPCDGEPSGDGACPVDSR